jgi:hypothetical protein
MSRRAMTPKIKTAKCITRAVAELSNFSEADRREIMNIVTIYLCQNDMHSVAAFLQTTTQAIDRARNEGPEGVTDDCKPESR